MEKYMWEQVITAITVTPKQQWTWEKEIEAKPFTRFLVILALLTYFPSTCYFKLPMQMLSFAPVCLAFYTSQKASGWDQWRLYSPFSSLCSWLWSGAQCSRRECLCSSAWRLCCHTPRCSLTASTDRIFSAQRHSWVGWLRVWAASLYLCLELFKKVKSWLAMYPPVMLVIYYTSIYIIPNHLKTNSAHMIRGGGKEQLLAN